MRRMIIARSAALLLILLTSLALASVGSDTGMNELKFHVGHSKQVLRKAKDLSKKINELQSLRSYVKAEIEKIRGMQKTDAGDKKLLIQLVGMDDDLGSFLDGGAKDFSAESCAAHRIALIHDYSGAGTEGRSEKELPQHAQDCLELLDLICQNPV